MKLWKPTVTFALALSCSARTGEPATATGAQATSALCKTTSRTTFEGREVSLCEAFFDEPPLLRLPGPTRLPDGTHEVTAVIGFRDHGARNGLVSFVTAGGRELALVDAQ